MDNLQLTDFGAHNLSVIHPKAADKKKIISWALDNFSRLPVRKRVLLLQYNAHTNESKTLSLVKFPDVDEERKLILSLAKNFNVEVVDTYDSLQNKNTEKMWDGHHTPLGNELVCKTLLSVFGSYGH